MASLWGAVEPVPAASVETLKGGERVDLGTLRLAHVVLRVPGRMWRGLARYWEKQGRRAG